MNFFKFSHVKYTCSQTCAVTGLSLSTCVHRNARPAARNDRRFLANVVGT